MVPIAAHHYLIVGSGADYQVRKLKALLFRRRRMSDAAFQS